MSQFLPSSYLPSGFTGQVRLFPLPNLVMFPHVLQPLHIFEPRYRALFEEAIATDRLITMAVLEPGWEDNYDGRPAVRPVACLGRVATYQRVEDGRYNLLLHGLRRVRVVRELPATKVFREAQVELLEDIYPADTVSQRAALHKRLVESFRQSLQKMPELKEHLDQLFGQEMPLGTLTDIVAFTLDLDRPQKEQLLAELNVDQRAALLAELVDAQDQTVTKGRRSRFPPPEFSVN